MPLSLLSIVPSPRSDKKYRATFKEWDRVFHTDFGAAGYSDFIHHRDIERRDRYDARHRKNENWSDPTSAGALSKFILWNKPTMAESIADYRRRFGL